MKLVSSLCFGFQISKFEDVSRRGQSAHHSYASLLPKKPSASLHVPQGHGQDGVKRDPEEDGKTFSTRQYRANEVAHQARLLAVKVHHQSLSSGTQRMEVEDQFLQSVF